MSGGGSLYAPIPHGGSGPSDNSIFSNGPRSEAYPEGGSDKGIDSGKGFNRPSSPLSGRSSNEQITDVPVPKSDSAPKLEKRHPTSSPSQSPLFKQEKTYGTAGDGKDSLRKLFKLPDDEKFVEEYLCALYKKILLQGRMYVFTNYVCFYSNVFGYTKVKTIALKDVMIVNRAYTAQGTFFCFFSIPENPARTACVVHHLVRVSTHPVRDSSSSRYEERTQYIRPTVCAYKRLTSISKILSRIQRD
jgi:hypothetical protein